MFDVGVTVESDGVAVDDDGLTIVEGMFDVGVTVESDGIITDTTGITIVLVNVENAALVPIIATARIKKRRYFFGN
jgi:hypothetical protein